MPDNVLLIVEILSVACYILATITFAIKKARKVSTVLWLAGVVWNAAIVVNNWLVNGYVPFISMYQVITFLSLTFALIYLLVKYRYGGGWMKGFFAAASGVCMIGVCFMSGKGVWHFPPSLQSAFFVPHVLAYMIAYSLTVVAFMLTLYSFFTKTMEQDIIEKGIYNLAITSFPFMTMGMMFGALWANEVWGSYWSFDAKENWSLVTWLTLCLYLHFRKDNKLKKYSKIFVILAFAGVLMTMVFVNMMGGSSQHTYSI